VLKHELKLLTLDVSAAERKGAAVRVFPSSTHSLIGLRGLMAMLYQSPLDL
jgi:hypothetical protein